MFRDELVNLFPGDRIARKLSAQVHTLGEFLGTLPGYRPPRIERKALLRDAASDTLIIADGFSCRSQIEHATDRRALHLAEVLQMALHEAPSRGSYPERDHVEVRQRAPTNLEVALAASVAFLAMRSIARVVHRM